MTVTSISEEIRRFWDDDAAKLAATLGPARTAPTRITKRCPTCEVTKPAGVFHIGRGRLSTYCKACQRVASRESYYRRRQDPAPAAQIRDRDRRPKRLGRAATVDPARERRNGRIRTAAARCLIATYRTVLREERAQHGVARMRHHRDPYGDHQ